MMCVPYCVVFSPRHSKGNIIYSSETIKDNRLVQGQLKVLGDISWGLVAPWNTDSLQKNPSSHTTHY